MRLAGKVALVTGAASGLGAEICRAFRKEGASVVITDIDENKGRPLADSLEAEWRYLDVTEEKNWSEVMSSVIQQFGKVDIVVNNAGILGIEDYSALHDPENLDLQSWRSVHRVNLDGTFLGCKYAIKAMRKTGRGSIINMSSMAGMMGVPSAASYASSKAAIRNHTKTVALYCLEQGLDVRCNSIHPGSILTPIWDPALGKGDDREERSKALATGIPMKRFGKPEEVAPVAVLLASDESSYITGAEFVIDGGTLAGR